MRTVAGRLKSDYSYSPTVYNSFPWPALTEANRNALEQSASEILSARTASPGASLADLYNPATMPAALRAAHRSNDKLVDRLYRRAAFRTEGQRVEHLFNLFVQNQSPIEASAKAKQ